MGMPQQWVKEKRLPDGSVVGMVKIGETHWYSLEHWKMYKMGNNCKTVYGFGSATTAFEEMIKQLGAKPSGEGEKTL